MYYSMLKTFANKYRTIVSKIKAKYVSNKDFTVEYYTKSGKKTAEFYNDGYDRERVAIKDANVSLPPHYLKYDKVNSFADRIRRGICELYNHKSADLAFHQVKKLKDLAGETLWERVMIQKRRKTLVVCPKCYEQIHS
jgi:hypothetical protein